MRFIVKDIKGVIKLINIMNGYFRTPKIETFHKLIQNINITRSENIPLLPLNTSSIDSDAWLAGFTEADGYFRIKIAYNKLKPESNPKIYCRFTIEQRQMDKPTGLSLPGFILLFILD
jgi:LAGLIDADG endonuclease